MNGIAIMLVAATVGVDYGWQPREDGTLEYIIQIEPELYQSLREGGEIVSEIHPDARNVSRIRIRIGREELPRVNAEQTPAGATIIDAQVRPASLETDVGAAGTTAEPAADSPESNTIRGQSPAASRAFNSSRYGQNSSSAGGYRTPTIGVPSSPANTGSSTGGSSGAASRYGGGSIGRREASAGVAVESHDGARTPRSLNPPDYGRQGVAHVGHSDEGSLPPKATAPPLSADAASTNPTLTSPTWRRGETTTSRQPPTTSSSATARQPPANAHSTAAQGGQNDVELGDLKAPEPHSHADGTVHESSADLPVYGRRPERPAAAPPRRDEYATPPPRRPDYREADQRGYAAAVTPPPRPAPNPPVYTAPYPQAAPPPGYVYQLAAAVPAAAPAAPVAAAPVASAPVATALDDHALSHHTALEEEGEKPWPTLVFTIILLFASIGGNLYLGWIAWDFGERYKSIASELRGINLAAG